jgi:uncharacterized membrane protein YccC
MRRLDPRMVIFSLNTFAAALLALYIAFSIGLPRPYWAMLTAYITAQPLSGAVRSKAVYRILGTLLGAAVTVALVPALDDSPALLSLALALWVGFCLFVSLLDRTPRAYAFMLSGYTAAIIGFPSVEDPGAIFGVAVTRVEEIGLGIICASLFHSLVFPSSVANALVGRIDGVLADASGWVRDALQGVRTEETDRERRRLAADSTELHVLASHLPFDTAQFRPTTQAVRALRDRLSLVPPVATAVEDRLEALGAPGHPLDAELRRLVAEAQAFAAAEGPDITSGDADRLIQACQDLQPRLQADSDWPTLLKASLLHRLAQLIDALRDCRDLRAYVREPTRQPPPRLAALISARARRPLHRDYGLALLSGGAAALATAFCCLFWIMTSWTDGSSAPLWAAVLCCLYATQDDPAPGIFTFTIYMTLALPLAGFYLFGILPAIDGFTALGLCMAPTLLTIGYFLADPRKSQRAFAVVWGFTGALSLTETFHANLANFINTSMAQIFGVLVALVVTRLFRSVGAEWTAWRILRSGWRDLALLARASVKPDRLAWTNQMLDRLGLLTPRLALAAADQRLAAADALNDLRIGLNVVDIQLARPTVGPRADAAIGGLMETLEGHFRAQAAGPSAQVDGRLLGQLDVAIGEVAASPPRPESHAAAIGLTGLRRSLFPAAPAYQPLPEPAL